MKIAIIGTGAYSIATAHALTKNKKNTIKMWTEDQNKVVEYQTTKKIKSIYDKELFEMTLSNNLEEVIKDTKLIIIIVAAHFLENTIKNMKPFLKKNQYIAIATKGIENNTCNFLTKIVYNTYKTKKIAVISGPSFAIDILNNEPIGLSIASKNYDTVKVVEKAYEDSDIKLRATKDIIGVQICGSIKNVIALAAGIISGLGYSNSAQAFLITESLHDIKGLIKALGGNPKTILSYAGVGDLLLTCTSTKSRNYSFGQLIGQNATKEEIETYLNNTTVEGYYTIKSIKKLIRKKKISLPIVNIIYNIIMNEENPNKLVEFLYKKK